MRLLSGVIGSDLRFPEPLQQRRAYSIFRDTNPQLVRINPECSRHGFGKAFLFALDEPVIAEVETGCFAPEAQGAKPLQLFPEISNGRFASLFRLTKKVIAELGHTAPDILALNRGSKGRLNGRCVPETR
jgi:hypothetical protein